MTDSVASDDLAALLRADPPAAAARLRQRAESGDTGAQRLYAQMLCEGRGIARDPQLGLHWYTVAATAGDAQAMNMVGRCHDTGYGTPADPALAALWYRKAADTGLDWGMYNLANLLATGRGVAADPQAAWQLYLQAAQLGHAKSMNLVGRMLEEGSVVPADPAAALDWYRRSAAAGDFRGQASLASVLLGQGRQEEALHWLQRAIAHGSPAFLRQLAAQIQASTQPALAALLPAINARLATLDPFATG